MSRFDPRGRVNRALLVGVSEYDHTKPDERDGVSGDLPAVKHNLNRLRDVLRTGGVFDEREITVCRSPSLDGFSEELRSAAHQAEGLLLCYFAGHGAVPSAGDELFLQMRNARVVAGGRAVFPGADPFTSVLTELAESRAERVVVVLDCCYAGNAAKIWHDFAGRRRILLLMSVQANRLIDSGNGRNPTPFTGELVRLLDRDGELSFLELFAGLRHRMAEAGHTTTLGDPWEPQHVAEPGADVLLTAPRPSRQPAEKEEPGGPGFSPPAATQESAPVEGAPSVRPARFEEPGPQDPPRAPDEGPEPRVPSAASGPGAPHPAPPDEPAPGPPSPRSLTLDGGEPRSSEQSGPSPESSEQPPRAGRGADRPVRRRLRGPAVLGPVGAAFGAVSRRVGLRCPHGRAGLGVTLVLTLAAVGLGSYAVVSLGDDRSCAPPLELRVLTDPDLEPTVRTAADTYLTSDANTTGDGCRRTGITVYSAGAADAVTALRQQTGAWQEPREEDTNPQRDVGPQPDVWIPASATDVARATADQTDRVFAELEPDTEPLAYSPVVLAVPRDSTAADAVQRTGRSLDRLVQDLKQRDKAAGVRRPDPEFTDSALLATVGLYGGTADARGAEQRVRQTGPPSPTSADLLCTLPDDEAVDNHTAALVPEFLMRSGVGCARTTRIPRLAAYPSDVPALTPTFVRVRWDGADRDATARDEAVARFHDWLTGEGGGLPAFAAAGFRSATRPGHPLLDADHPGTGVLPRPEHLPGAGEQTAMDTALRQYRSANGPGRVLYLLDSSGSMGGLWEGPSGGPGILKQSLGGLGDQDEYGVWAVYGVSGDRRHTTLLPFGRHRRTDAEHTVDTGAQVRDAEADPHAALLDALDDMAGRGTDDKRPQLIVYLTDDEDNSRLTGRNLDEVLARARRSKVPVDMVSLVSGACDKGRADARVAEASGGRCLDASDDLGTGLHDEVARVGTGDD